jgi:exopolysaccharide biosynthesis WecB/TagA/CpsF family protein
MSPQESNNPSRCDLLGVSLVNVKRQIFKDIIISDIRAKRRKVLVTPNIDHFVRMQKNKNLKRLYINADYCVNDSRIFSLLIKLIFKRDIETITGSDLTFDLFQSRRLDGLSIAIVGGDNVQIETLCERFQLTKNNVKHINPPMGFIDDKMKLAELSQFICDSKADVLFLAVGSPQQEILADLVVGQLTRGVILCVGASIDYLTGKETRAPQFMQRLYLEWLFRFMQSPVKRFKRYFINCPQIFYYLLKEKFKS